MAVSNATPKLDRTFALPTRERVVARTAGVAREHLRVMWSELKSFDDKALELFQLIARAQLVVRAGREPEPEYLEEDLARVWQTYSNMSDSTIKTLSRLTEVLIAARTKGARQV
jgi:hypothetical protein